MHTSTVDEEWEQYLRSGELAVAPSPPPSTLPSNLPPPPVWDDIQLHITTKTQDMKMTGDATVTSAPPTAETAVAAGDPVMAEAAPPFLDIAPLFWRIPVIPFHEEREGVVKKEIRVRSRTREEHCVMEAARNAFLAAAADPVEGIENEPFVERVTRHVENEQASKKKFYDVRKLSVGTCTKDIINSNRKLKKAFANCIVLYLRYLDPARGEAACEPLYLESHIKVFHTGSISVLGKSTPETLAVIRDHLLRIFVPLSEAGAVRNISMNLSNTAKKVLINSGFQCGFPLYLGSEDPTDLTRGVRGVLQRMGIETIARNSPGLLCRYYYRNDLDARAAPAAQTGRVAVEDYALKIEELKASPRYTLVTFTLFSTGKCLLAGNCSDPILRFVFDWLIAMLRDNYADVRDVRQSARVSPVLIRKPRTSQTRKRVAWVAAAAAATRGEN